MKYTSKLASVLSLSIGTAAIATSGIWNTWNNIYPDSDSGAHASCALCHASTSSGSLWNAYGWKIRQLRDDGHSTSEAIMLAADFDSDSDPGAAMNGDEIAASTQPGWTDGPFNSVFHSNGTEDTGISPPSGITGDMDPAMACDGDTNGDGMVAVSDLLAVLGAWGAPGGDADVTHDGIVDIQDLLLVLANWGSC